MNIIAQCCGIVIMIVLLFFYQGKRRLKLNTSLLYRFTWNIVGVSLILDIVSLIGITYADSLPMILVDIICKAYLWSIVMEALGAMMYVCVDVYKGKSMEKRWMIGSVVVAAVCTGIIFCLPIHIYNNNHRMYTYGPSVIATYLLAASILIVIICLVGKYRAEINPRRKRGVTIWWLLWMIAAIIQFFNNQLLLVSFASVVGMLIIFGESRHKSGQGHRLV